MQVEQNQLKRQQEILAVLGFYHGKVDGIWGPKSIEAKKKFEANATFTPGIPNNGMPFGERPPYPTGITFDHATGLLTHPKLTEKVQQAEAAYVAPAAETPKALQQQQSKK